MANVVIREDGAGVLRSTTESEAFPDGSERRKILFALSVLVFVGWLISAALPFSMSGLNHLLLGVAVVLGLMGLSQRAGEQSLALPDRMGWTSLEQKAVAEPNWRVAHARMEVRLQQWAERTAALETRAHASGVERRDELLADVEVLKKVEVIGRECATSEASSDETRSDLEGRWARLTDAVEGVWTRIH